MRRFFLLVLLASTALAVEPTTKNQFAGCMITPNNSVFNTRIDQLPVDPHSEMWTKAVATAGIAIGPAWGINIVDNSTPSKKLTFHYTTQRDGKTYQIPPPPARFRETGSLTTDGNNDHHMISVNRQTCHVFETYQQGNGVKGWDAASGWDYDGDSYELASPEDGGGTTDAAGLPLLPLTPRLAEVRAGAIEHAMRFTSCLGCIHASRPLWPAVGANGSGETKAPPMGARFRLKSNFDISHFSPTAQIFLTALKRYGMFLADIGAEMSIQASDDLNEDAAVVAALAEIQAAHIMPSSFEVVDESGLEANPRSNEVLPGTGRVKKAPQPVLIGLQYPTVTVQAGTPGYQIPAWVNGAAKDRLTWKLESGPGTISRNGLYKAPESVAKPEQFSVVACTTDGGVTANLVGWVIPSGDIKIDAGSKASAEGWLSDRMGVTTSNFAAETEFNHGQAWPADVHPAVRSFMYTWGDDIQWGPYIVPNGSYDVSFTIALGCSGQIDRKPFDNGLVWGPLSFEVNGTDEVFDWVSAVGDHCRTPATKTMRATVTDNKLILAVRALGGQNAHTTPVMSALVVRRRNS